MKKLLSFITIFIVSIANGELPNIVALVNNEPITLYEFESRKKMLIKLNNIQNLDSNTNRQLDKFAMNSLIDESILQQHAAQVGGKVSNEEIDETIASIEQKNNMSKGHLIKSFGDRSLAESFRSQIRSELIKINIMSYLSKSVTVSPKEIDIVILTANSKDIKVSAQVYTSKEKDAKTLSKMSNLRKSLRNCNNIKKQMYEKFADITNIEENLSALDPQLQTMIKDLNANQPSKVFETTGGFKVILICNKEFHYISTEENTYITNFLTNKKISQKAQKFLDTLRKKAYIKVMIPG